MKAIAFLGAIAHKSILLSTMTQTIRIPALEVNESTLGCRKKLSIVVRMSDLRGIDFPLNPNVRHPSKNAIVRSILKSIEDSPSGYTIEDPLFLSARSYEKFASNRQSSRYLVELVFNEYDGLVDGGHRKLAERLANLSRNVYATENVFMTLNVEFGLSKEQIKEKAIALNTSRSPKIADIANYQGYFDWLKQATEGSQYTKIEYFSNQEDVYSNSWCKAINLSRLVKSMDTEIFNPKDLSLPFRNRHPAWLAREGFSDKGSYAYTPIVGDDVILDILGIVCDIAKELGASHARSPMPFIKEHIVTKKMIHLPNGEVLGFYGSFRFFGVIIGSCFRVAMEDGEWIYPLDSFKKQLIRGSVAQLKVLLHTKERARHAMHSIHTDTELWERMYGNAQKIFDKAVRDDAA